MASTAVRSTSVIHFGDTLRHVLPAMSSEISELPQFFDTIEKLYQIYQVRDDLKAKLLIPKLSSRAKCIIVRMTAENLEKYDEVKKFLLAEYKLTPREYKNRFDSAVKGNDETKRRPAYVVVISGAGSGMAGRAAAIQI